MTTKRIAESGTISVNPTTKALRVCLITEGAGSSADFPREFFTQANADALGGSLSWPAHPVDLSKPYQRDPLTAIGQIAEQVTIEEHDGKLSFWGEYIPAKSKPQIAEYLAEFGHKLGLSVYGDSDGHNDSTTGRWIAESLDGGDPYKSVDLVVAAGRGGKFEKVAESLGLITKASATAGEEEVSQMEIKEVNDSVVALTKVVEGLVSTLTGKAKADLQVEVDTAAAEKLAEARLADYNKAVGLISEAKLTESQSESLRTRAMKGEDITGAVEHEKKVLAEALASVNAGDDDEGKQRIAEHLGGGDPKGAVDYDIPGFGQV